MAQPSADGVGLEVGDAVGCLLVRTDAAGTLAVFAMVRSARSCCCLLTLQPARATSFGRQFSFV